MGKIIIFTDKDYTGEFSILKHERILILKAAKRCSKNRERMAELLEISERTLYRKIIAHGLNNEL